MRRTSLKIVSRRDTVEGSGAAEYTNRPGQFGRVGRNRGQDTDDSGRALADRAGLVPVAVGTVPFGGLDKKPSPTAFKMPISGKRRTMCGLMERDSEVHGKKEEGQRRGAEIPSCTAYCAVDH